MRQVRMNAHPTESVAMNALPQADRQECVDHRQVAMHALPVTSGRPEGDLTGPLLESHHRMRLVDALQLGDIG